MYDGGLPLGKEDGWTGIGNACAKDQYVGKNGSTTRRSRHTGRQASLSENSDQMDEKQVVLRGDHGVEDCKSSDSAGTGDGDSTRGLPSYQERVKSCQELAKKVNQPEQAMDYLRGGSLQRNLDTLTAHPSNPSPLEYPVTTTQLTDAAENA